MERINPVGMSSCSSEGLIVLVLVVVLVLDTAYFSQRFRTPAGVNPREDSSVCDNRSHITWLFEYEDDVRTLLLIRR